MSFASYPDDDRPGDPRELSQLPPHPTLAERAAGAAARTLGCVAGLVLSLDAAIRRCRP